MSRRRSILLAALALLGCDPTKELRAQQSAGGVLRALKVLHDAGNAEKARALPGLARAPCFGEGVCELRDGCRAAYALHVEGVTLTQAAKQQLRDGNAEGASKLLGSAEEKLKAAAPRVSACVEQAADLRRRYKL